MKRRWRSEPDRQIHTTFNCTRLKDAIKELLVESLMLKMSKEQLRDDLPLFGPVGLGLDSIDALELVVALGQKFGVTMPSSEVARTALATVDSLCAYVAASREKQSAP
ncbi:MAG: phosphopantetheine-binding protein [Verrucomicrobiota bacterium]